MHLPKLAPRKPATAQSPVRLAWGRLRRNALFWASAPVLGLVVLASMFAYALAPDDSPHCNRQLTAWAVLPPGTTAQALLLPLNNPTPIPGLLAGLWGGWSPAHTWVPLADSASQPNAQGCYTLPGGEMRCLPAGVPAQVATVSFPLGSDTLGRCVFSRLLLGGRVSLLVGLLAVAISLSVGVGLGLAAGYLRGRTDAAIQWLMAVVWSVPTLLLALAIAFALGRGLGTLALAIGLTTWVDLARMVRGQVLALREREYITAARAMGYGHARVMFGHLLPNLWGPILIVAVANFGAAVLLEAGLSFLGLGVAAPTPSWGGMVYEGYQYLALSGGQWMALFPGTAIALTLLALNLLGVALRDALDVRAD